MFESCGRCCNERNETNERAAGVEKKEEEEESCKGEEKKGRGGMGWGTREEESRQKGELRRERESL